MYAAQTYTVSGSGSGVDGTTDQFTFVHQRLAGDATLIARVHTLPLAVPNAQAGVMIRQGLGEGAKHGAVLLSHGDGITFERRRSSGGGTTTTATGSGNTSAWVRIDRRGSTIVASWSADGSTWTAIGTDTVSVNDSLYIGLVVASRTIVAPVQVLFTGVQAASLVNYGGPLPGGWASQDIGGPAQPGTAAFDAGTFGIRGGGADIAGSWDQFHYAYRAADGDVDIVARVRDLGNIDGQSKAGVMVRDSLTGNGAHASMLITASGASIFRRRPDGGASTTDTPGPPRNSSPVWVKLSVRDGVVTSSWSADGSSWTVVGTETVTLPSPFYVGLPVTSRNDAATVTTNIDGVTVTIVSPQNSAPIVTLTDPASGATFDAPATITVAADATDADGTIANVDFFHASTLIGSDTTAPYDVTWTNVAAGTYSLTAVATDDNHATTTSAAVSVTVNGVNERPTVALTSPANGATFSEPANITVSATATVGDGRIARVDFFHGTNLIGSDATTPYSVTWNDVQAGTYSVTAIATHHDGATTSSAARTVTVIAASGQRKAVFTPSADHDTLVNSYLLEIFAAGANPATATPIARQSLGKPAVVNDECTADVTTTINGLSPGTYQATVSALGNGESARSEPATFTR